MQAAATDGVTALRGTIVTCRDDPFLTDPAKAFAAETDGIVVCRNGMIEQVGPAAEIMRSLPAGTQVTHYEGCLIAPGFIDTHVHYVQTGMIASYGEQLLDWLDRYAFPAEMAFKRSRACRGDGAGVLRRAPAQRHDDGAGLLRRVSAVGRCAVRRGRARGMRMIAGKVLMDRNAPGNCATPRSAATTIEGADRALARPRPLALCGHAALCRNEHAGAARCRRCVVARASGSC